MVKAYVPIHSKLIEEVEAWIRNLKSNLSDYINENIDPNELLVHRGQEGEPDEFITYGVLKTHIVKELKTLIAAKEDEVMELQKILELYIQLQGCYEELIREKKCAEVHGSDKRNVSSSNKQCGSSNNCRRNKEESHSPTSKNESTSNRENRLKITQQFNAIVKRQVNSVIRPLAIRIDKLQQFMKDSYSSLNCKLTVCTDLLQSRKLNVVGDQVCNDFRQLRKLHSPTVVSDQLVLDNYSVPFESDLNSVSKSSDCTASTVEDTSNNLIDKNQFEISNLQLSIKELINQRANLQRKISKCSDSPSERDSLVSKIKSYTASIRSLTSNIVRLQSEIDQELSRRKQIVLAEQAEIQKRKEMLRVQEQLKRREEYKQQRKIKKKARIAARQDALFKKKAKLTNAVTHNCAKDECIVTPAEQLSESSSKVSNDIDIPLVYNDDSMCNLSYKESRMLYLHRQKQYKLKDRQKQVLCRFKECATPKLSKRAKKKHADSEAVRDYISDDCVGVQVSDVDEYNCESWT